MRVRVYGTKAIRHPRTFMPVISAEKEWLLPFRPDSARCFRPPPIARTKRRVRPDDDHPYSFPLSSSYSSYSPSYPAPFPSLHHLPQYLHSPTSPPRHPLLLSHRYQPQIRASGSLTPSSIHFLVFSTSFPTSFQSSTSSRIIWPTSSVFFTERRHAWFSSSFAFGTPDDVVLSSY